MKAKKSLGQYFLFDQRILQKIIKAGKLVAEDIVLEIGPGTGILTSILSEHSKKVVAVEKDRELCNFLKNKFLNQKNIEIICGDILKINPYNLGLKSNRFKLVANIPYYITGRLLRQIFTTWPKPSLAVLMLQKEVAERIVAKPPKMNRLSAICQYFSSPQIVSFVKRSSFRPIPKVDSAIVVLKNIKPYKPEDKFVERIISIGFTHPRKLLSTNLASNFSKEKIKEALSKLRYPKTIRPAELAVEDWWNLSTIIFDKKII